MGEVSLLITSAIASSVHNLDSSRCRNPNLEKRKEGWTEIWGGRGTALNTTDNHHRLDNAWRHEEIAIERQLATPHPQKSLTLVQHRVAWFEQLVLRIAGIPHIVVNSPYAALEATGPLPFIKDFRPSKPPILVGRHHPGLSLARGTTILEYLQTEREVNLDLDLSSQQKAQLYMLTTLVNEQLESVLVSLRYGDRDTWTQVYRHQYIRAATKTSETIAYVPRLFAWFQAWSVRQVSLKQLKTAWSVEEALSLARTCYECLDTLLQAEGNSLLGTVHPTTADALVWSHLAEALCDVHLVTVLADYPKIVQFFQRIYDTYFRLPLSSSSIGDGDDWRCWNHHENSRNPFQQIPMQDLTKRPSRFRDALELMQTLSVHTRDLQEVLTVSKAKRFQEESFKKKQTPREKTILYRWRLGGEIYSDANEESESHEETPLQRKWRADNKYADELWVTSVLAGIVLVMAFVRPTSKR